MLVKDPALIQTLQTVTGDQVLPVSLKLRHFGQETLLKVYNNLCMEDLIFKISHVTQLEPNTLSVKVVEDTVIRRVDRKLVSIDNPTIKNTLRDLKIVDNSALLIELKDPAELEAEASEDQEVKKLAKTDDE